MKQDVRAPFDRALDHARRTAFPPGEYVGQESFMRATEIRRLARRGGIGPGTSVLDVCCGVAGPGRLIAAETGCDYLGVDASVDALALARERAVGLPCRFESGRVPPLPEGRYEAVLLLETMLAFADKATLLAGVSASLAPGGRFVFTAEVGLPLTPAEQRAMPDAETVRLLPLSALRDALDRAGLRPRWLGQCTGAHRRAAAALLQAFTADRPRLAEALGERAVDDLLAAHRLWVDWLTSGRVRKFAGVAEPAARR